MKTYHTALQQILDTGEERQDRTGTGTIGLFGLQQRYNLAQGFPAVTTKKLAWKSVVSELLWFIEGSGDEKRLREILHGSRDTDKTTIWSANATADYWKPKAQFDGDLGRVYGVQWRHWKTARHARAGSFKDSYGSYYSVAGGVHETETDQLKLLIDGLYRDPYGRRHILSAWNPGELESMALPPCHVLSQFYVDSKGRLSCQMYQRSCDMFLGVPFNIASYSLLTHMIAQVCGFEVGEFVHVLGDAHIYLNHVEQVKTQLERKPYPLPTLWLNPAVKDITKFTMADIELRDYTYHESISAPMAV
jgi:thymidylate synthase